MKRNAFTMIELIFVIVILGVLAAMAIPKLSATRDDAKLVREIAFAKRCVQDAATSYTALGTLTGFSSPNCDGAALGVTITTTIGVDSVTVAGSGTAIDGTHVFAGASASF